MNSEIAIDLTNLQLEISDLKTLLNFIPDDIPADSLELKHIGGERGLHNTIRGIQFQIERVNQELESIPSGYRHPHEMKDLFRYAIFSIDNFDSLYSTIKEQFEEVARVQVIIDEYGSLETIKELNIPQQSASLKLGFKSGKISVLDSSAFDNAGNEKALIEVLHGPLLEALKSARNTLNQGNMAYGFLADNLSNYLAAVDKPIDTINFGEVFLKAKQIEAALVLAKEYDLGGDFPQFPPQARIDIEAILDSHKPFMQASNIGSQIVANSEYYDKTPEELKVLRSDISELKLLIENSVDLVEENTAELVIEALNISNEKQNVKNIVFANRVAKNLGIVSLKISIFGALGLGATAIPGVGPTLGAAVGIVGTQSVKKGASMDQLLADMKTMKSASQEAGIEAFEKIRDFVSINATLLSRTTSLDDDGKWFKQGLKVLKRGAKLNPSTTIKPNPATIVANNPILLEHRTSKQINDELMNIYVNSNSPQEDVKNLFSEIKGKKVKWTLFFDGWVTESTQITNGVQCQLTSGGFVITCELYELDMEMLRADALSPGTELILEGILAENGNLNSCRYLGIEVS